MIDLAKVQGQRVKFSYIPNGETDAVELEGTVDLVNPPAMIVKPKGSTMVKLIEERQIVQGTFEVIPEKPRELKARRMDPVGMSSVRNHLLDRHGYELDVINKLTDAAALAEHDQLEHDRLGHFHAPRPTGEQSED